MVAKKPASSHTDAVVTEVVEVTKESPSVLHTILLIILIVLSAFQLYFLMGNSLGTSSSSMDPIGIKKALLEIEYDKVGGRGNYEVINELQRLTLTSPENPQNIDAMKQYISQLKGGTGTTTPSQNGTTGVSTAQEMSTSDIATILSGAVIEGNADADIIVVEYSDMECPFCIRQHNETKLKESLQSQYGDKVAFVLKNNRGVNHSGTEAKAIGALCAQKVGGKEAYVKFYTAILSASNTSGVVYPVADLAKLAGEVGVDVQAWQSCVDNKETLALFTAQTSEAQKYNLNGTPGTLLINRTTGKYDTVEGAYPFTTFTQKIDALLQ